MATDRELVRWYWPHVWALDKTLHGLQDVTISTSGPSPNMMSRQLELVRRFKAQTYAANR